jgi:CRISPR-associated endonuclease Csn1
MNGFTYIVAKGEFQNSQIRYRIITKYANAYLKSYFGRVESVKGGMVASLEKLWGSGKLY